MVVEYLAGSDDGKGRGYARQTSAQQLPRSVRTLAVYGSTHKEVGMSGAHYEIVRRPVGSSTLPPIHNLRKQLTRLWQRHDDEQATAEIKHFPIRVINARVASTLQHVASLGFAVPSSLEAIAYELAAARDVATATILPQFRPELLCTGANKHVFALEYLECEFMVSFLRELQKRDRCLHYMVARWLVG